jgi:MSHA pilin protein MshC
MSISRRRYADRAWGFTTLELIVTLAIAGIVAAVAVSRLMGKEGFEDRGFYDQAITVIRYAQKTAIAQRRMVFAVATADRVAACYDAGCTAGQEVPAPFAFPRTPSMASGLVKCANNAAWLCAGAPDGVTVSAATISFNGLGRPSAAATITVSGSPARSILVEAETGYVHN